MSSAMSLKELKERIDSTTTGLKEYWLTLGALAFDVFSHCTQHNMNGEPIAYMYMKLEACDMGPTLLNAFKAAAYECVAMRISLDKENEKYKCKLDKDKWAKLKVKLPVKINNETKQVSTYAKHMRILKKEGLTKFKVVKRKGGGNANSKNGKVKDQFEVIAEELVGVFHDWNETSPDDKTLNSLRNEFAQLLAKVKEQYDLLAQAKLAMGEKILNKDKKEDDDIPELDDAA